MWLLGLWQTALLSAERRRKHSLSRSLPLPSFCLYLDVQQQQLLLEEQVSEPTFTSTFKCRFMFNEAPLSDASHVNAIKVSHTSHAYECHGLESSITCINNQWRYNSHGNH
jgi:hypothetical protein